MKSKSNSKVVNGVRPHLSKLTKIACGALLALALIIASLNHLTMTGLFAKNGKPSQKATSPTGQILNAGFVCVDKVYNSELVAPYDVLQHSYYRDSTNYIRCFIVTPDGKPFTTFEGIRMVPDFSFKDVPPIDILVIPSTGTSMTADLQNAELMRWLKRAVSRASYVITVCDGAFPLAATGAVDGRTVTTFPADRKRLSEMFPQVNVRFDANFVVDGKFITSVGGARSYEPALFLVEKLYSKEHALRIAKGLVLDWDLHRIPHVIVGTDGKTF